MKILVACEESQTVTIAFRNKGHEAYSCDLLDCSGSHPEWHLKGDVRFWLYEPFVWDMIIAFPPCTDLAVSGAKHFEQKRKDGRQKRAIDFFIELATNSCPKIAIENPVSIMSSVWRKPDQIIQPWQFGESYSKKTCLWLKGLPLLKPTKIVDKGERITYPSGKSLPAWYANLSPKTRARLRGITPKGLANAMAEQWS